MRWLTNWFQNISRRFFLSAGALLAALLLTVAPLAAQDVVEQHYQQAHDAYDNTKMEDACELFQQVEKEKPGYKDTKIFLKVACDQANRLIKAEDDLFNQGFQLFNQGHYDDAKDKFEKAIKIPLKNPKHRGDALRYIKDADSRLGEDQQFQDAVKLFNAGNFAEAQSRFNQVVQGSGPKAADARGYLKQIDDALGKLFANGVERFNSGKYAEARSAFEKVATAGGARGSDAQSYLKQISKLQSQPAEKPGGQQVASSTGAKPARTPEEKVAGSTATSAKAAASEQTLRAGLQAYFEGRVDEAERYLSDYISNSGQKQALAYFFRGATRGTRYFLSGGNDTSQRDLAAADFRALKNQSAPFQPPEKFVSPKILTLYLEAINSQ